MALNRLDIKQVKGTLGVNVTEDNSGYNVTSNWHPESFLQSGYSQASFTPPSIRLPQPVGMTTISVTITPSNRSNRYNLTGSVTIDTSSLKDLVDSFVIIPVHGSYTDGRPFRSLTKVNIVTYTGTSTAYIGGITATFNSQDTITRTVCEAMNPDGTWVKVPFPTDVRYHIPIIHTFTKRGDTL